MFIKNKKCGKTFTKNQGYAPLSLDQSVYLNNKEELMLIYYV